MINTNGIIIKNNNHIHYSFESFNHLTGYLSINTSLYNNQRMVIEIPKLNRNLKNDEVIHLLVPYGHITTNMSFISYTYTSEEGVEKNYVVNLYASDGSFADVSGSEGHYIKVKHTINGTDTHVFTLVS